MRILFFCCLIIFTTVSTSFAQDLSVKFAETITAPDLRSHLSIIASDSFEGRNTGEKGQKLAAAYIANQFESFGFQPIVKNGDSLSFFQHFDVYKRIWDDPYLIVNGEKKDFLQDFFTLGNPNLENEETLEVVFGGEGIDDISAHKVDFKGKSVVIFLGKSASQNVTAAKTNNLILSSNFNKKYRQLLENGAKAVFIIPGKNDSVFTSFLNQYKCKMEAPEIFVKSKPKLYNNLFFIPTSLGAKMLGISLQKLQELEAKPDYSNSDFKKLNPEKIKIRAAKRIDTLETENVLGYLEGTDKKDEVLVITAHYDHEGIVCGEIYNGADDDGSGVSAVLELAEAFSLAKKQGHGPRRSILFMPVTGEEKGLLGSAYYTQNPVFPLSQTIANLNIDMIGRMDALHKNEDYIYLIGSDRLSTQLHRISEEANSNINLFLDYRYNALDDPNQFYYRSDHYNFAKNNVPAIFYFSGVHEDYHKPTDDIEKILFNKVTKTTRLIFHTAWELVNREERIYVDVK